MLSNLARSQLPESHRAKYDAVLRAVYDHRTQVDDMLPDIAAVSRIVDAVLLDHPDIFWFDGSGTLRTSATDAGVNRAWFSFQYECDLAERKRLQSHIDTAVTNFLKSIPANTGEYGKTLAVYEYIIRTTEYDSAAVHGQSIVGALIYQRAVCQGYAKATQYLLSRLGIPCTLVTGEAVRRGAHAWNLVVLSGDCYYLDTTWGDPLFTGEAAADPDLVSYDYFCVTSADISATHAAVGGAKLPSCTATRYNYFVYNGLLLDSFDLVRLRAIVRNAAREGKQSVTVRFSNRRSYDLALRELFERKQVFGLFESADVAGDRTSRSVSYSHDDQRWTLRIQVR